MTELSWKQMVSTSFENSNLIQLKMYWPCLYMYVSIRFSRSQAAKSWVELNSFEACSLYLDVHWKMQHRIKYFQENNLYVNYA